MKKALNKVMSVIQTVQIFIGTVVIILFLIPTILKIKPFIVQSGSMENAVKTGAIAYNNSYAKPENVKEGDIIVFKLNETYVTHRVIKINEDNTFTTKGDANETEDLAPVRYEDFRGKLLFSIPYLGYVIESFKTKLGIFVILSITGINIVYFIFSSDEEEEKNIKK